MKIIQDFLIFILSFLLIITLSLSIFSFVTINSLLNPELYKNYLTNLSYDTYLNKFISPQYKIDKNYQILFNSIYKRYKPKIEQKAEAIFSGIFDYLTGKSETYVVKINTQPLKRDVKNILSDLKKDYEEQLPLVGLSPATESAKNIRLLIESKIQAIDSIPDRIDIGEALTGKISMFGPGARDFKKYRGMFIELWNKRFYPLFIPLILVSLIILVAFSIKRVSTVLSFDLSVSAFFLFILTRFNLKSLQGFLPDKYSFIYKSGLIGLVLSVKKEFDVILSNYIFFMIIASAIFAIIAIFLFFTKPNTKKNIVITKQPISISNHRENISAYSTVSESSSNVKEIKNSEEKEVEIKNIDLNSL